MTKEKNSWRNFKDESPPENSVVWCWGGILLVLAEVKNKKLRPYQSHEFYENKFDYWMFLEFPERPNLSSPPG